MLIKKLFLIFSLTTFILAGCAAEAVKKDEAEQSQTPAAAMEEPAASSPEQQKYEALLERVKHSDDTVDFQEFRILYTKTPFFVPVPYNEKREQMMDAFQKGKYKTALQHAGDVLSSNYVDFDAHYVSMVSFKEQGEQEMERFHEFVLSGLIRSILQSGDGQSPETAFVVINVREEYILMELLGLTMQKQSVLESGGHIYDRLEVVDSETGEERELYFNVDIPFAAYDRLLGEEGADASP